MKRCLWRLMWRCRGKNRVKQASGIGENAHIRSSQLHALVEASSSETG